MLADDRIEARAQFDSLYRSTRRRAYGFAYRYTGNAAEAADLVQDAYLRAWNNFGKYDSSRSFEAWMLRILANLAIDQGRRAKRVRFVPIETLTSCGTRHADWEPAAPGADPYEEVARGMASERVRRAVNALPATYRAVLSLCALQRRPYAEVAERLGCPVGTVRSRVHRARVILRARLDAADRDCLDCLPA